jgi:hypothetical protein
MYVHFRMVGIKVISINSNHLLFNVTKVHYGKRMNT